MVRIKVIILIGGLSISAQGSSSRTDCPSLLDRLAGVREVDRSHKRWPDFVFRNKKQRIRNHLHIVFNTDMSHPEHIDGIMNIWTLSQGRPDLIDIKDVHRLRDLFIKSMVQRTPVHYEASTARTLALILKMYIYDSEIVSLFRDILTAPRFLQLSNFSNYSHLLVLEVMVSALRDYMEHHRPSATLQLGILVEIRDLLEKQLTEMDDFYIQYPNAYKNQSTLLETAVVNIVEDIGNLTPLYPSVIESLFKRLALLYANKSSVHEDSALIEKHRITIRMIRTHLEPDHIFSLARSTDSDLRSALVQFFTRDFHSPSPEILEEVEKLLVYQQQYFVRETGVSILAGRELAGKGDEPYVSHQFKESVEWLQPPTTAPSRLNPGNMRLIYELSQRDENSSVRQIAQQVVDLTRNREDLEGYVNEAQ